MQLYYTCLNTQNIRLHRRCRGVVVSNTNGPTVEICAFCNWPKIVQMHHFDLTWPEHRLYMGQLRPPKPQLPPNLDPLGSNFGPTWRQHAPVWEQLCPKLRSIWLQNGGHGRPNPKSSKSPFSLVFSMFFGYWWRFVWSNVPHVGSRLGPTWCEAVAKRAPSCAMLTWTFMCITWLQFGVHLDGSGPTSARHDQLATTWAPGPKTMQPGPNLQTQCGTLKAYIFTTTAISNVFWLWWGFVQGHVAHIGPVSGPTRGQMPPHRTKLRPSSGQVGPKLKPTGRKLRPLLLRSTKGQGRPSLTPVGFWLGQSRPASFLSVLFPWCGRISSRSDSKNIFSWAVSKYHQISPSISTYVYAFTGFEYLLRVYQGCPSTGDSARFSPACEAVVGSERMLRGRKFSWRIKIAGKMGMPSKTLSKNVLNTKELLSPKIGNKMKFGTTHKSSNIPKKISRSAAKGHFVVGGAHTALPFRHWVGKVKIPVNPTR